MAMALLGVPIEFRYRLIASNEFDTNYLNLYYQYHAP